mmetsp:Transcript_131116/g.355919  ORF Transcript_131116/g.355919 Transcript_131116/m.355919 type:complete len:230 (+) Transcript_131116:882-1571(+)
MSGRDSRALGDDVLRGIPARHVVLSGPPRLCDAGTPPPGLFLAPLAHVQMNVAACPVECIGHVPIRNDRIHVVMVAPIHLDHVHPPLGKSGSILVPMVSGPGPLTHTCPGPPASVQPIGETPAVRVLDQFLHAPGEMAAICLKKSRGVPGPVCPAVVQVEVAVSCLVQADLVERVDGGFHAGLVAEVELWRLRGSRGFFWAEGHPTGPAERGHLRVRRAVVEAAGAPGQ